MFSFSHPRDFRRTDLAQMAKFYLHGAWKLMGWPARVMHARRDMALLARMNHHELADIGLLRADINNASALPLDADPTEFLASAAISRRARSSALVKPRDP